MKKVSYLAVMLLTAGSLIIAGCDGPAQNGVGNDTEQPDNSGTNGGNSGYDENAEVPEMTAEEQKDYLVSVGQDVKTIFNPEDQRQAVDLAAGLYNKYQNYNWDVVGSQLEEEFNKLDAQGFFRMPLRIAALASGEVSSVEDKSFIVSFAVAGRLFEFDDNTQTMKVSETNDGTIIARFKDENGTNCELKVWGEGKTSTVTFAYEDYHWEYEYDEYGSITNSTKVYDGTRTIKAEVPAKIHMYLKQGNTTIMSFDFAWDSNFKNYVNHSLTLKVTNITWNQELKASTTDASAVFSLTYGNKNLVTAAVNIPKYKLIDWQGGKDITLEEGESWIEQYCDTYTSLFGTLGKGEGVVDVLGKVRGKMSVSDGAGFYNDLETWGNTSYETDFMNEQAFCDICNTYVHVGLYYGGKTEQAQVKMQPTYSYTDDYGEERYESIPVLYFPKDDTTYEIGGFFDESKFNVLIDLAEDIINAYKDLDTGHLLFGEEPIELN